MDIGGKNLHIYMYISKIIRIRVCTTRRGGSQNKRGKIRSVGFAACSGEIRMRQASQRQRGEVTQHGPCSLKRQLDDIPKSGETPGPCSVDLAREPATWRDLQRLSREVARFGALTSQRETAKFAASSSQRQAANWRDSSVHLAASSGNSARFTEGTSQREVAKFAATTS